MSASLVGSEMCIRDSGGCCRLFGTSVNMISGALRVPRVAVHARTRGGRTVSYTHLTLPTICSV
eukprot:11602857-Alexandrium_andersonii.AAC.1